MEASFIFGASFNTIGGNGTIPFKDLGCVEGFADEDQIQTAYTDEFGTTQMKMYVYFGEWLDDEYNPVEDTAGIAQGGSAWFISSEPKSIQTSGEVSRAPFVHTFTESSQLIASAFPQAFCPNSANVSWGVSDESQIQTAYTDENGTSQMRMYVYFGEWLDDEYNTLDPDQAIVDAGMGFWIILNDASETFTETSPLAAE